MFRMFDLVLDYIILGVVLLVFVGGGMIIITSTISLAQCRLEMDSAKRIVQYYAEKENTVSLKEIESELKSKFPARKLGYGQYSEMEFVYGDDMNNSGDNKDKETGYYGRTLDLRIVRKFKGFWYKEPITLSVGISAINRSNMTPTKDVEYRIGNEFMS